MIKPTGEQFLTTVPVAVLTNETIFSSTNDFVDTCMNYDLATVIGNMVPLSGFGLPTPIVLPSGKYVLYNSTQENRDHNGAELENVTKEPAVFTEQTLDDFYRDRDTVLQVALDTVRDGIGGQN